MQTVINSIKIFNLTEGKYNQEEIKTCYRKLASCNHPDKGGDTEAMQLINKAYDDLLEYFKHNDNLMIDNDIINTASKSFNFEFIKEIKTMQGIVIEVCGYWVWLGGDTFEHKDKIKALKFKFSSAKKKWYWSPTIDENQYRRGSKSMKQIRSKYGSVIIETESAKNIKAG